MEPQSFLHHFPLQTIVPHIRPLLQSLPILRRIQFHLQTNYSTVIASFPPSTITKPPADFALAYVDRSRAPETECWLFSTAEVASTAGLRPDNEEGASEDQHRARLIAVLAQIPSLSLPPWFPKEQDPRLIKAGAVHGITLALLKGGPIQENDGIHVLTDTTAKLAEAPAEEYGGPRGTPKERRHGSNLQPQPVKGSGFSNGCLKGHTVSYAKYLFKPEMFTPTTNSSMLEGQEGLPVGVVWTQIERSELPLVISRTNIPRTPRTMSLLPAVGLRLSDSSLGESEEEVKGRLIGWAFLGADASLSSLHIEPEFRGKGLAKLLTRRVFGLLASGVEPEKGMVPVTEEGNPLLDQRKGFFGVAKGETWCHSDVARDNAASTAVAIGLGGLEKWECYWSWIDLGRVTDEIKGVRD